MDTFIKVFGSCLLMKGIWKFTVILEGLAYLEPLKVDIKLSVWSVFVSFKDSSYDFYHVPTLVYLFKNTDSEW